MADAALKTEAPKGAENFSAKPPTAEAAKPVGPTEANIASTLVRLGGEKTPDPDRSLLSIMSAGGGESTLAGEDSLKHQSENKTTNVTDLTTGKQMTQEEGLQRARQGESDNPQTIDKAANDNEKLDPNAETKEQKMQRLSQELSDNRKKYVEATRWFGSSTASGELNKDDSERAYKESLKSYREAKMTDVQEQIASDPSLREKPEGSDKSGADKLIEDTLREFTIGEFKNLQEDDAEIRLQKRKENLGEWGANAIDKVKDMLESYRKMKAWKKIGLSVTANILTGGSALIVLRGLGIAASSSAYKEMMEGKAESMRDTRWENVNQEGLSEAKTENGLDIDKVKDFLNNQSDNMADKFQSYKKMRFARTVGSIGAAVGISVGGSYAFRELMQTDTAQMVKEKAVDVAQNIGNEFGIGTANAAEPQPGDQVLPPEQKVMVAGGSAEASGKIAQLEQIREKMFAKLDEIEATKAGLSPESEAYKKAVELENQTMRSLAKVQGEIAAHTVGASLRDAGEQDAAKAVGSAGTAVESSIAEPKGGVAGEAGKPDFDKARGMFAAGEGGVMTDGEDPPAAETVAAKTYDVQKGDNIWKIIDKALGDQKLSEAQRTYAIDEIKDKFSKMTPDDLKAIGISSGDINKLSVDDNIDLKNIFGEKGGAITIAAEHARNISADQIASIEQNNDKISDFFGRNKGVEMTSENIDKVLQGKGDTLITPDDATSAAEDALKKAGEKIGNIADLEQKAKDVLGQYGQRRTGESDSAYLHRVNEAARMMGVDLYSASPKADVSAVIPDARSSGSGSSAAESASQAGSAQKAPEGGVDWSKPPEGYEPRVQPPSENQTPPSEPVKTYTAGSGAGKATNFEGYGVKIANDGQGNIRTEGSDWSAYQRADGSSGFRDGNIASSKDAAGTVTINRDAAEAFARVSRPEDAFSALSSEPKTGSDKIEIPGMKTEAEVRAEERAAKRAARAWKRFFYDAGIKDSVKGSKFWSQAARKIFR